MNKTWCIVISVLLWCHGGSFACANEASSKVSFGEYIEGVKAEAVQKGFEQHFLDTVLADVTYRERVVNADRNQPERKITLDDYLASRVPDWKVKQALDRAQEHQELLEKVSSAFGVQPRFILALWGNESNFGKIQGSYPVLSSLATMAYDGRREALFRRNLFAALTIIDEGHISAEKMLGSWAGAMGQSQFMPLSFLTYAVDFDGDGRKDIWQSHADVFASIANYLASEGWQDEITWGRQVKLLPSVSAKDAGLARNKMRLLADWQAQGVRRYDGSALPVNTIDASLIMPDGNDGRIYLVYENFHTLMKWNKSLYFGVSVGYLADRIKRGY